MRKIELKKLESIQGGAFFPGCVGMVGFMAAGIAVAATGGASLLLMGFALASGGAGVFTGYLCAQ